MNISYRQAFKPSEVSPDHADWQHLTSLERQFHLDRMGWGCPEASKPRRPRQSSGMIAEIVDDANSALEAITLAEMKAGPAASVQISDAKRFQAAHCIGIERTNVCRQLLGQRNGLHRVLTLQEHCDLIMKVNDRVLAFLDSILDLSANAAALSGSDWKSTETWLARNFPVVYEEIRGLAQASFEAKLAKSAIAIAARVVVNRYDYRTAPSVTEIAARFEITTHQLRVARARSGLTSIDRADTKTRWRERSEAHRRANGSRPQFEMTTRAEDGRLASLVGCTDRTIRAHRLKGDLAAWLASKGIDFPHPSLPKDSCEETKLGSPPDRAEVVVISDVYDFHGKARPNHEAVGTVSRDAATLPFQGKSFCPISAAHSDG